MGNTSVTFDSQPPDFRDLVDFHQPKTRDKRVPFPIARTAKGTSHLLMGDHGSHKLPMLEAPQSLFTLYKVEDSQSDLQISPVDFYDSITNQDNIFGLYFHSVTPNSAKNLPSKIKVSTQIFNMENLLPHQNMTFSNLFAEGSWTCEVYGITPENKSKMKLPAAVCLANYLRLAKKLRSNSTCTSFTRWLFDQKLSQPQTLPLEQIRADMQNSGSNMLLLDIGSVMLSLDFVRTPLGPPSLLRSMTEQALSPSRDPYAHENLTPEECCELMESNDALLKHKFQTICSRITDFLFLGSRVVAEDFHKLMHFRITHILNCAGAECKNAFPNHFKYTTLYVNDNAQTDISKFFLLVVDLIESVRQSGGRILVHCNKGISRSPTIIICYLMWLQGWDYYKALKYCQQCRFISDPNTNFSLQLMHKWQRRLKGEITLHRLAPHGQSTAPQFSLPTQEYDAVVSRLDPRTFFILITPSCVWIWIGSETKGSDMLNRAQELVKQFQKYTRAVQSVAVIRQGDESENPDFAVALGHTGPFVIRNNDEYDKDYEQVPISPRGPSGAGSGVMSPRGPILSPRRSPAPVPQSPRNQAASPATVPLSPRHSGVPPLNTQVPNPATQHGATATAPSSRGTISKMAEFVSPRSSLKPSTPQLPRSVSQMPVGKSLSLGRASGASFNLRLPLPKGEGIAPLNSVRGQGSRNSEPTTFRSISSSSQTSKTAMPMPQTDLDDPYLFRCEITNQGHQLRNVSDWDEDDFESKGVFLVDSRAAKRIVVWVGSNSSFRRSEASSLATTYMREHHSEEQQQHYRIEIISENSDPEAKDFFNDPVFFHE